MKRPARIIAAETGGFILHHSQVRPYPPAQRLRLLYQYSHMTQPGDDWLPAMARECVSGVRRLRTMTSVRHLEGVVRALVETTLLTLDRSQLHSLMEQLPRIGIEISRVLSLRLRHTTRSLHQAGMEQD